MIYLPCWKLFSCVSTKEDSFSGNQDPHKMSATLSAAFQTQRYLFLKSQGQISPRCDQQVREKSKNGTL